MSDSSRPVEVVCRFGRGAPIDFGETLLCLLDEHLHQPFDRLRLHQTADSPKRTVAEVVANIRSRLASGERPTFSGITPNERAAVIERISGGFHHDASGVRWRLEGESFESSQATVEAMGGIVEIHLSSCSVGPDTIGARNQHRTQSLRSRYELNEAMRLGRREALLGIAPVQWFGPAFVDAFGGDDVFKQLPEGWAEEVRPKLWKVYGSDGTHERTTEWNRFSDRERAIIEALGPEFFFNVETGELATEFVEIPIATQYPVYLWDEKAGELVIHEPDGSTRSANLGGPAEASSSVEPAPSGPRALSYLVVERMNEVLGDESFEVDDQLYWVELHLENLSELDDVWVEAFSVWLGEHVIKGILDAKWVERAGRWVVSSPRGVFDPEPVVLATLGSAARGESLVMVTAACEAMGIPLP